MKMENNDSTCSALDRIHDAGARFVGAIKAKRLAIAEFYAVYLDALADKRTQETIQRAFADLPKVPKSSDLAAQICYLGLSLERRRVSEVKKDLVDAHTARIEAGRMYEWLVARARKRHSNKTKKLEQASVKPKVHAFAAKMFSEAPKKSRLDKSPVPVACKPGDFLIQILRASAQRHFHRQLD